MLRCLIIDGSPIIRKVAAAILADFGYEAAEAATAKDGLALFHRQIPRLAIVDASVPDMPVLDVLRQMRAAAAGRTQVLYCTTEFEIMALRRAHAAGATDVLIKPFDRASIVARLDAWSQAGQGVPPPRIHPRLPHREAARLARIA